MKNLFLAMAALFALALPEGALAQSVLALPVSLSQGVVSDFGNGPLRFKAITGQGVVFTSSGSGVSGAIAASTAMVLTAAPATPPCVGCVVSGTGVAAGTTVAAFSGSTITLSAAMTVAANTPVSWGAACPASLGAQRVAMIGSGDNLPFWTAARLCGSAAPGQPGAQVLTSAVNTVQ